MTALYYETGNELMHYGVKGMKWGVRKDQITSGVRNAQIKRAKKNIAKADKKLVKTTAKLDKANAELDRYKRSGGSSLDYLTGNIEQTFARGNLDKARKLTTKKRKLEEKKKTNQEIINELEKNSTRIVSKTAMKNAIAKGAGAASSVALWSVADDIFYDGAQKQAIKTVGRAATTAFLKANGSISVEWLD